MKPRLVRVTLTEADILALKILVDRFQASVILSDTLLHAGEVAEEAVNKLESCFKLAGEKCNKLNDLT